MIAALPLDVRKVFDLPVYPRLVWGRPGFSRPLHVCGLKYLGRSPINLSSPRGRSETFRTSGGEAANQSQASNARTFLQTSYLARIDSRDSSAGLGFERASLRLAQCG